MRERPGLVLNVFRKIEKTGAWLGLPKDLGDPFADMDPGTSAAGHIRVAVTMCAGARNRTEPSCPAKDLSSRRAASSSAA